MVLIVVLLGISAAAAALWDSGWGPIVFEKVWRWGAKRWAERLIGFAIVSAGSMAFVEAVNLNVRKEWVIPLLLPAIWNLMNVPLTLVFFVISQRGQGINISAGWVWGLVFLFSGLVAAFAAVMWQRSLGY